MPAPRPHRPGRQRLPEDVHREHPRRRHSLRRHLHHLARRQPRGHRKGRRQEDRGCRQRRRRPQARRVLLPRELHLHRLRVHVAAQDVREKVDGILSDLPSGAERPVIQKIDINATAIANIFLTGDLPLDQLYDYADNILADRFSSIHGVGKVELIGGNEREIWIELDRDRLAASGLTAQDVATTVAGGILSVPGGRIREADSETSLKFDAEYTDVADIASLNLLARDGARLSVADLGAVRSASEEIRKLATLDGRSGVLLKVVKKGEANVVELVSDLRRRFDELAADLPGGMSLVWVSDEAAFITESYHSTLLSIAQAVGLCALILFFFLANLRTTLIVAITMPVTLAISVYFMQVLGQTFNMVSLLAMGLSTGVLVSNSIVVLESIVSHLETASDPWTAAREGTDEVAVSVLASAGTNVVVMFPIAMMTSMAGRMLKPFAITTLIVNLVSILISFTLTPILSALVLRAAARKAPGPRARFGRRWAASSTPTASSAPSPAAAASPSPSSSSSPPPSGPASTTPAPASAST